MKQWIKPSQVVLYGLFIVVMLPLAYLLLSTVHTAFRDIFLGAPPIWALDEKTSPLVQLQGCQRVGRSKHAVIARIQDGARQRDVHLPCFPVRYDELPGNPATLRLLSEPGIPFYLRSGSIRMVFIDSEERYVEDTSSRRAFALWISLLAAVILPIGWQALKSAAAYQRALLAGFRQAFDEAYLGLRVPATVDGPVFSGKDATVIHDREFLDKHQNYTRTVYARNHAGEYFKYRFDGTKGVLTHLPRSIAKLVLKDKFVE